MFLLIFLRLAFLAALAKSHGSHSQVFLADQPSPAAQRIFRELPSGRSFLLNVPAAYNAAISYPLVLSFHGAGGTSESQETRSQLSDPELRIAGLPFLTVYPQGVNNSDWNITRIWKGAPYANDSVDDIQFIKDIIADVSSNFTIDPSRKYASGKSNGGGLTALLACRHDTTSLFAAFAPVSPALYPGTLAFSHCDPVRPVPIYHAHGILDVVTSYYGRGPLEPGYGPEPDVRVWRRQWAERNGCKGETGTLPEPDEVFHPHVNTTEEIWHCQGAEVRALTIDYLGHSWPTTEGLDPSGSPNHVATFNFTHQHLVQFFSSHQLPAEYL
ncbi:Alpha/Beta hydrolase protein [Naematelia encephala]|uniref:feruloyl esterase n=1 Tax=Naematelia encephala TaxID=71784 RepID=A0A1Y2AXG4_9TREE|nr:Alpha/Beta hydrolase protein [Naematelia encephala]